MRKYNELSTKRNYDAMFPSWQFTTVTGTIYKQSNLNCGKNPSTCAFLAFHFVHSLSINNE